MIATRHNNIQIGVVLILYGANYLYVLQNCQNEQWHQNITQLMDIAIPRIQRRCVERNKMWEEELIAKAWHPDRFMDWCWDIEEQKEFTLED